MGSGVTTLSPHRPLLNCDRTTLPPTAYVQGAVETRLRHVGLTIVTDTPEALPSSQHYRAGMEHPPNNSPALACVRTIRSLSTTGSRSGLRHQLNSRQLGSGWVGFLKILSKMLLAEAQGLSMLKPLSQNVKDELVYYRGGPPSPRTNNLPTPWPAKHHWRIYSSMGGALLL